MSSEWSNLLVSSVLSCQNFDTLQLELKGDKIPLPVSKDILEWAIDTQQIMHAAKLSKLS